MAGKWEGFSEEDINNYIQNNEDENETDNKPKHKIANFERKKAKKEKIFTNKLESETKVEIQKEQKLSQEDKEALPLMADNTKLIMQELKPVTNGPVCIKILEGKGYEVLEKDVENVSCGTLQMFQAKQKLLEEQNRKRKELLAKALADRKKKTTAEARRLQNIQEELQKLDLSLSNDVNILRDQIEVASLHFMEAQKRFDHAEKEFVDAKFSLFKCLEKKELLTQHLCTIIEQNELRKAQKLSELMDKLDIGSLDSGSDESESFKTVILSPYKESALVSDSQDVDVTNIGESNQSYNKSCSTLNNSEEAV